MNVPVMRASAPVMAPSMRGVETTRLSRTIARILPTFALVTRLNFATPSLLSTKRTAGALYSSIVALAVRRSRPVTAETLRSRKNSFAATTPGAGFCAEPW